MSCNSPLRGFRPREGGSVSLGYHAGEQGDALELPCGRCVGCRLDRSRQWSIRIMHESMLYDSNRFVTLTYDAAHLPASLSLEYVDFQLFMKRLRRKIGAFRYFVSGEYGEQYQRPHWHAILFGCVFGDEVRYVNDTSRSALCEKTWGKGDVVIGDVSPQSAAYVAGYTLSKVYGREAYEDVVDVRTGELTSRRPPFCAMSLKPGIGARWYARFQGDILPHDFAVDHMGRKWKVPSYYWRKFQAEGDPQTVEDIQERRYSRAMEVDRSESSPERRMDKEIVALSRMKVLSPRRL